ncbi:hypothetical protein [Pseudoxanthomonas sp. JBR18]|uniref:hypothetical protein n=1 Tax=Pseudoxanthomonas sp. JBR18 TaxID=2969308 RepID=UPI002305C1EA|nr:hypothetical protein [Pseudoxanthomonas sp. JBR18]WCE03169.1 hypothetical protein PJ250_13720 [Pseudoxanthomonas sp. JBR18]
MRPKALPKLTEGDRAVGAAFYALLISHGHLVESFTEVGAFLKQATITDGMSMHEASDAWNETLRADGHTVVHRTPQENAAWMVDFIEAVGRVDPAAEQEFWRLTDVWAEREGTDRLVLARPVR